MNPTNQDRILYLISGHNAGRLTLTEQLELEHWTAQDEENKQLFIQLTDKTSLGQNTAVWSTDDTETALHAVKAKIGHQKRQRKGYIYTIAAVLITALAAVSIYYFSFKTEQYRAYNGEAVYQLASSIVPGTKGATLTLGNGTVIDLQRAGTGNIAEQDGIQISKIEDGQISYEGSGTAKPLPSLYHTVATPKGGQYKVRLPDGTLVMLNAATTLTYPASFQHGKERRVELKGEAYFEVAHDQSRPFIVKTALQTTKVLGTHFNINSYADEERSNVTLAEGSVLVTDLKGKQVVIRPGQSAIVTDHSLSVSNVDVELALAWKEGKLQFQKMPLAEIMKMVARWYDIDIAYPQGIPNRSFTGKIDRSNNLSVLLRILDASSINFEIVISENGSKTLVVKP